MPIWFWESLFILVLILANGLFAAAEIAIVAARKGRLQQLADEGDRKAKLALALAADPNRFLPTVQVGITLVSTLAAVFAGQTLVSTLAEQFASVPVAFIANNSHGLATGVIVLAITFLSLMFGELVPKRLALRYAEGLARFVGAVDERDARARRSPCIWLMGQTTNAVLFVLRTRADTEPTRDAWTTSST